MRALAESREITLLLLVILLALAMSVVYPENFPTAANLRAVLLNLAPVGILVCGMMLLMIGGTFDLSCGSTLALCRRLGRRRRPAGGAGRPSSAS